MLSTIGGSAGAIGVVAGAIGVVAGTILLETHINSGFGAAQNSILLVLLTNRDAARFDGANLI